MPELVERSIEGGCGVPRSGVARQQGTNEQRVDDVVIGEDGSPLHDVPELTDVAGPGIASEERARFRREPQGGPAELPPEVGEEGASERVDVIGALVQRRQLHREHGIGERTLWTKLKKHGV